MYIYGLSVNKGLLVSCILEILRTLRIIIITLHHHVNEHDCLPHVI